MEEKERKKPFGYLLYIAMGICILFAMFALLNVTKVQEDCKEYYLNYIDSNCQCGSQEVNNYGLTLEVDWNESKNTNQNT